MNYVRMCVLDVQQEKQHNQLIQSVEGFNTEVLRKTETVEKGVLPNAEGNLIAECNALNSKTFDRKNVAQLNLQTLAQTRVNNWNGQFYWALTCLN